MNKALDSPLSGHPTELNTANLGNKMPQDPMSLVYQTNQIALCNENELSGGSQEWSWAYFGLLPMFVLFLGYIK